MVLLRAMTLGDSWALVVRRTVSDDDITVAFAWEGRKREPHG